MAALRLAPRPLAQVRGRGAACRAGVVAAWLALAVRPSRATLPHPPLMCSGQPAGASGQPAPQPHAPQRQQRGQRRAHHAACGPRPRCHAHPALRLCCCPAGDWHLARSAPRRGGAVAICSALHPWRRAEPLWVAAQPDRCGACHRMVCFVLVGASCRAGSGGAAQRLAGLTPRSDAEPCSDSASAHRQHFIHPCGIARLRKPLHPFWRHLPGGRACPACCHSCDAPACALGAPRAALLETPPHRHPAPAPAPVPVQAAPLSRAPFPRWSMRPCPALRVRPRCPWYRQPRRPALCAQSAPLGPTSWTSCWAACL